MGQLVSRRIMVGFWPLRMVSIRFNDEFGYLDRPLAAGVNTVTAVDAAGVGDGGAIFLHIDSVNRAYPDTGITFLAEGFVSRNDLHVVTLTLIKSIAFTFRVHRPA